MHKYWKRPATLTVIVLLVFMMTLPLTACQIEIPGIGTVNIKDSDLPNNGGNMSGEIGGNLGNERTRTKRMLGGDLRGHVGGSVFGKVMGDVTGTVDGDVTEIKGNIAPGAVIKGRVDRLHGKNNGTVLGGIVRMG